MQFRHVEIQRSTDALVVQIVALIAVFLLSPKQGEGFGLLWDYDADRAAAAYNWMLGNLTGRARDALLDLEREPTSEDNKADLRKQLTKLLQTEPSLAKDLGDIVPGSTKNHSIDVGKVALALNIGNDKIGIFKKQNWH